MATLASQPVTLTGLDLAHAVASAGGDRFTPGADVLLHVINGSGSTVTVTVPVQVPALDSHVADVAVTVAAGTDRLIGPFPASFFAHPSDGLARISYSSATGVQVAAFGTARRPDMARGTIVTRSNTVPADLPSGALWVTDTGDMYLTASGAAGGGLPVSSGSSVPSDLPDGSVYVQVVGGVAQALYVTPGVSALDIATVGTAPANLAANQLRVVLGPDGVPTDLYIGGVS